MDDRRARAPTAAAAAAAGDAVRFVSSRGGRRGGGGRTTVAGARAPRRRIDDRRTDAMEGWTTTTTTTRAGRRAAGTCEKENAERAYARGARDAVSRAFASSSSSSNNLSPATSGDDGLDYYNAPERLFRDALIADRVRCGAASPDRSRTLSDLLAAFTSIAGETATMRTAAPRAPSAGFRDACTPAPPETYETLARAALMREHHRSLARGRTGFFRTAEENAAVRVSEDDKSTLRDVLENHLRRMPTLDDDDDDPRAGYDGLRLTLLPYIESYVG